MLKYFECEHSLNLIKERLAKIESLLNRQTKCNLAHINKYQDELQKAFNDTECINANLNLIAKLTNKIKFDSNQQQLKLNFDGDLKNTDAKLIQLKYRMPDYLKRLNKTVSQLASIEDGLSNIEFWTSEGENLFRAESERLSFDQCWKRMEEIKVS